ncbi:MAG: zinc-ribbon domain-containing protein, partial [Lachnospiraceae bacterium]|nr:zinc-ribbon domain-containing protein [Lachnospiraceae bacterium]
MFCSNCGKEIEDDASFCGFCGQKLREAGPADSNGPEPANNNRPDIFSDTVVSKKKNNTGPVIAIAAVAVLLIAVGIVIFVKSASPARKYEEQLKLAQRYLYELDYDKAIAAYRAAIEIDPKSEAAYLGMAQSYAEKGELQAAIDILKEGLEKTESVSMEERLAELERQFAGQKARELVNWQGGEWTNRDDILPHKNEEGYIVFGAYEQDGDESNGPEPIEWEILEENGKGTFLVSRYVLDA